MTITERQKQLMRCNGVLQIADVTRAKLSALPSVTQEDIRNAWNIMHPQEDPITFLEDKVIPAFQQIAEALDIIASPLRVFIEKLAAQFLILVPAKARLSPKWQRIAYRLQMVQYSKRQRKTMRYRRRR